MIALCPKKMEIDCSRHVCPAQTDRQSDTLAFLELLSKKRYSEAKIIIIIIKDFIFNNDSKDKRFVFF